MGSQLALFDEGVVSEKGALSRLLDLREKAMVCQACPLAKGRTRVVFGTGSYDSPRLAFIGEAPGHFEDQSGAPFVGPAGQLLDKMLKAMGFARRDVYIVNAVCCRPPGNRTPEAEELSACKGLLFGQLRAVRPRVIVTLGATATSALCVGVKGKNGKAPAISRLRGRWFSWEETPVMPTYHPAYLLRPDGAPKRKEVWADLQAVLRKLEVLDLEKGAR